MIKDKEILEMYTSLGNGEEWEYNTEALKDTNFGGVWHKFKIGMEINKNWSYRKIDPLRDKWIAVMFGADLEPRLATEGYAGYNCPLFNSKEDCIKWIADWEESHKGTWLKRKAWVACETEEETAAYEKAATDVCNKVLKLSKAKYDANFYKDIKEVISDYIGVEVEE